jgi:ferredoxin-type protein NapH
MTLRQKVRLSVLYLIFLTFPITLNYFSVYLIIESSAQGIASFTLFFWGAFTLTSLVFGRAACGYICPLGAIQETKDRMAPKKLTQIKYLRIIKYFFAVAWVGAVAFAAISAGGYKRIELLYNTPSGVSVDSVMSWFTYFTIVVVLLLPAFLIGKRGFCHYFCPWGVLNMVGTKIKDAFRWNSLHLKVAPENCKQCKTCDKNCPMSLPISQMVSAGSMRHNECILCGTCADTCPNGTIRYSWGRPQKS